MAGRLDLEYPIVALVASAGGLEAASCVLEGLPADLPAAVVVLIHQSPEHISRLAPLLARRCALPVEPAGHDLPLRARRVVVVPPGRHLLVVPGPRSVLIDSGPYPPNRPSADLLLATLATAVGPRAIAVVLSGGGHDGATGAAAVHALGGTVFATDEESSATFSMPLAAIERDEAVDRILPLAEVGEALVEQVAQPR